MGLILAGWMQAQAKKICEGEVALINGGHLPYNIKDQVRIQGRVEV